MSKNSAKAAAERLKKQQEQGGEKGTEQKVFSPEVNTSTKEEAFATAGENDQKQIDVSNSASSDFAKQTPETEEQSTQGAELKDDSEGDTGSNFQAEKLEPKMADGNELVQVEFVGPYKRYSRGDIASFSKEVAAEMIEKGAAALPGRALKTEKDPV